MKQAKAGESGFDAGRLVRLREVLERCVAERAFPGGVYSVARHGRIAALEAFGNRDDDPVAPATVDTVYDLASVTKAAACASAAMILLERGRLHALEEARSFFPEHDLPHWEGITIHHLLTHTSGLPDWTETYKNGTSEAAVMAAIFAEKMKAPPAERYEYSCLGYITLGKIVERVSGEPLDAFTARELYGPLGMASTGYRRISSTPPAGAADNIAPTVSLERARPKLYGEVHDGNASALDGVSGNAGLFGTASDLLRYGQMLLNGGELDGARVLGPLTVRHMLKRQTKRKVGGHTWGFFCEPNGMLPAGDVLKHGAVGHSGFTGTSLVIHPKLDMVAVLLTNRVLYDTSLHLRARRLFHNALAAALTEV